MSGARDVRITGRCFDCRGHPSVQDAGGSKLTPQMIELFSRCILADALSGAASPEIIYRAGLTVFHRMRGPLDTLVGPLGVQALLNRALRISQRTVPWLAPVYIEEDGSLFGLAEAVPEISRESLIVGFTTLIHNLLVLLAGLIGEQLAWRLIHEIWPELRMVSDPHHQRGTRCGSSTKRPA